MEDGAPAHKAKEQRDAYKKAEAVKLPWPGNSPDLNPIEHVWDLLKDRIDSRKPHRPTTITELKRAWQEEWERLMVAEINGFIAKMPKRV